MSLLITATPTGSSATNYVAISTTSGRQAIDFDPGAKLQQQFRFKSVGVAGQFLIRANQTGRNISMTVRYMDTKSAAETMYQNDCDAFTLKQVELVCNGQTYKGCNVVPESIKRSRSIRPVGRGDSNQIYFDVHMTFTQDNPDGV